MIVLTINFSSNDVDRNMPNFFRKRIFDFIKFQSAYSSKLLSSSLNKNGVSFYLITLDQSIVATLKAEFKMEELVEVVDFTDLGFEYGNQDLVF